MLKNIQRSSTVFLLHAVNYSHLPTISFCFRIFIGSNEQFIANLGQIQQTKEYLTIIRRRGGDYRGIFAETKSR